MPPLKGVFHLAATLNDGLLAEQGAERTCGANGIELKAPGTLHMATADSPLEHFVPFSSLQLRW